MKKLLFPVFSLFVCPHSFSQSIQESFKTFANDTLAINDARLLEHPSKNYNAEDILNNKIEWRNPYHPNTTPNGTGFDASRLGRAPATGTHPRIFTSPDEFASIKSRLETTKMGAQLMKLANDAIEKMEKGEGKTGKAYSILKQREWNSQQDSLLPKELSNLMAVKGLLVQVRNDKSQMDETGLVAGRLIRAMLAEAEAKPDNPAHHFQVKEIYYGGGDLAKLFDFTAACLNETDKKYFIEQYAKATNGKFSVSMELPPHWRRWNHVAMSIAYPLSILAIENEKGYDKRIAERGKEVLQDYLTYTFSDMGMSTEGIGYTFGPFPNDLLTMAAFARRDKTYNPFVNPHFRAIPDWLIQTLSANPAALWYSHGDTGSTAEIPWLMMMIMKYFFPNDGKIDYLYAHSLYKEVKLVPDVSAYVFCNDPQKTIEEYQALPPVEMPLTYFEPTRGSLIARNKWDKNAVVFQFDARQDMLYQSHDHSDRGNFLLASHGRVWVMDGWRSTESKYHSVITIDGHGQGYFATPAEWKSFIDKSEATFGTVDYSYPFAWRWLKSPVADAMLGKTLEPQWRDGPYQNTANNLLRYYPGEKPERDPLRKVADYFGGNLATNPLIWSEDTWPMRLKNYPVEYAYRTAGIIKGNHTYCLVVDDLKKDGKEHLYEWNMPMQLDVELVSIKQLVDVTMLSGPTTIGFNSFANSRTQGEYDITLGDKRMKRNMAEVESNMGGIYSTGRFTPQKGDPQLLVRVLESTESAIPNEEPNPRLETFENLKTENMHQFYLRSMDLAKKLVIPSRSVEPRFKVLLFPYLHGEELPKTLWNADRTELIVSWNDQRDVFHFTKGADGKTQTTLTRDGKVVF